MGRVARGYIVHTPEYSAFMDCGDIEARWIQSMADECRAEAEEAYRIDQPWTMPDVCDDCGEYLHEDTPGVLECANGHKFRAASPPAHDEDRQSG